MPYQKLIIPILLLLMLNATSIYAAKVINLRYPPGLMFQSFFPIGKISNLPFLYSAAYANHGVSVREISRTVDSKGVMHIRLQETYHGYDIIGADSVVHVKPHSQIPGPLTHLAGTLGAHTMNGFFYQDLDADLGHVPSWLFIPAQAEKALQQGILLHQQETGSSLAEISQKESKLMIYVDDNKKARWVYRVSFHGEWNDSNQRPVEPVYLLDAMTFEVITHWDDIKTLAMTDVEAGGFGGNAKTGYRLYDGLSDHFASFNMKRNENTNTCFLQNEDVTVRDFNTSAILSFPCEITDANHNNVYWNASFDAVNQGYSPGNDAFFGGMMVKKMYQDWYGVPVLSDEKGNAIMLNLYVHKRKYDDAYWNNATETMVFGDGLIYFYPLTSIDIAAHEMSHGFTSQHSGLMFTGQSGAMNESFSDMAAQAAEVYAYGDGKEDNNSWKIAASVFKQPGKALRYLDMPSQDCGPRTPPNGCSINDASQYKNGINPHFASGVYNRFFYTLAKTPDWNVRKAFEVMVHANRYYWTAGSTFDEGACNVISAASQLSYDVNAVKQAFDVVKVKYSQFC